MTSRRTFWVKATMLTAALLALAATPSAARAADRMDELQERFKQRFAEVRRHKDAGQLGETSAGMVDAVKAGAADAALAKLIAEENADRAELYALIAQKENTTADVVARTNARRNFQRAKAGDWLKADDGTWRQK
jgi:uncharacterized protein YdbL (DUF1318 family)